MIDRQGASRHHLSTRRGLSLMEVVVSTLIVGLVMVAALNSVGAQIRGQRKVADRGRGWLLAQEMLSEVLRQSYEEPDDTPVLGRESSESSSNRANYDDVDDYRGWDASPPMQKDGTVITDLTGWRRTVSVEYVSPSDFATVVSSDQKVKRIVVTVYYNSTQVAQITTIRTKAFQEPPFE